MKLLATLILLAATTSSGFAQARGISGNGFDSGGINITPEESEKKVAKTVRTIQYIAVSPMRQWKSSDKEKKPITGTLLAFAREKESGKLRIVREEKVRLLVGEKDFTVALEKLSLDDQAYVQDLVDSARIAGKLLEPEQAEAAKEGGSPASTGRGAKATPGAKAKSARAATKAEE